jgi:hypothetical protein
MRPAILACLLLMVGHGVSLAAPGEKWKGASDRLESLPEPVVVNGVALEVRSARGWEAAALASRLPEEWSRSPEHPAARPETLGNWTIVSRIQGHHLEVLQWRGSGVETRLLWSRSDLNARIQAAPELLLGFPSGCVVGTSVHGSAGSRAYVQTSGRCRGSARSVLSAFGTQARRRGLSFRLQEGTLTTGNRNTDVLVTAWPSKDRAGTARTSVVFLQTGREGGPQ